MILSFSPFCTAPTVITTVFISFYYFISFLLFGGEKFGGGGEWGQTAFARLEIL